MPPNGPLDCTPMTSRPPSSVGPNSLLSTPGIGRKKPHTNSNMAGDGWQTVGAMTPNKFQLKRVKKKYIEPGTSVICIHSKVRKYLERFLKILIWMHLLSDIYLKLCSIRSIFQEKIYIALLK